MASEGLPVQMATRILGVSESGYYGALHRAPSAGSIRHAWLLDQIRAVHAASNGTYGARRVQRTPPAGTVIHSDRGVQVGSWAFTDRAEASGLVPSMGSIADCFDNAMIESFWSRMLVEVLDRRRWRTRIELANAMFEYLEIWHNRRRRHSALGWLSPLEFENQSKIVVA
jgi:putative transposase